MPLLCKAVVLLLAVDSTMTANRIIIVGASALVSCWIVVMVHS